MDEDRLKLAMEKWRVPDPPASLDHRVLAGFRGQMLAVPLWRRLLRARIIVPVPAIVLATIAVVVAGFWRSSPISVPQSRTEVRDIVASPCVPSAEPPREVQSLMIALPAGPRYITAADLTGFVPVRDGKITIRTKGKRP